MILFRKLSFLLLLSTLFVASCDKKDKYIDYTVTFFIDHPNYRIDTAVFELVTEQVISRESHHEGATFITKHEGTIEKDGFNSYHIYDESNTSMVINCETNEVYDLLCRDFLNVANITPVFNSALYSIRYFEKVLVDGSGLIIPATYTYRSYYKLIKDGAITPINGDERMTKQVKFRIPSGVSIDDYIQNELHKNGVSNCLAGTSYIVE